MKRSVNISIGLALVGLFLVFLAIRVGQGKMIAPLPSKETIETTTLIRDGNGVPVGESVEPVERTSWKGVWTWIAALLTLSILSFLYDDNPFYKFAEHLFIGVSAAYWMVLGFWATLLPNLIGKLAPRFLAHIGLMEGLEGQRTDWFYLIPLVFGLLLLCRLSGRFGWISRWSLAFIVGTTAGLNFVQYLSSDFMMQIHQSLKPLVVTSSVELTVSSSPAICTISNILLFLGVFCGLIYFFFSVEHKGFFGVAGRIGIWILMISFGASFGFTVMGRIALLVGRMEFLLGDWLGFL